MTGNQYVNQDLEINRYSLIATSPWMRNRLEEIIDELAAMYRDYADRKELLCNAVWDSNLHPMIELYMNRDKRGMFKAPNYGRKKTL